MLQNIPPVRAMIYCLLIGLLPILFVFINFISEQNHINEFRNNIQEMEQMAVLREKKQAINMAVRNHYRDADHFYIDKYLETLVFLEPEVESLHKIINDKNFPDDELVKKRLETLTGPANSLVFSEGVVQSTPLFQETTETQVHPVEVNGSDLQKILAKIDGMEIGAHTPGPNLPQLIILDFKLDRKNITEKNEVFVLNLKLLKREFL